MDDQGEEYTNEAAGEAASSFLLSYEMKPESAGALMKVKVEKGSSVASHSTNPSSSSYSTAEGNTPEGNPVSNGFYEFSNVSNRRANMSVDYLQAHIRHLESLLAGKEAALMAVSQELDAVKEMSCIDASMGPIPSHFDADFKASIAEYNRKLQEHAAAIYQRDEMIQKLADSLKQSVRDREELKNEAACLTEQVHSLQSQLHSVREHVQNPPTKLLEALKEKDMQLQKKSAELNQSKAQSAKEVQFLMSSLEELQQRVARNASSSPPVPGLKVVEIESQISKDYRELRNQYESEKKKFNDQMIATQKTETFLRSQLAAVQEECSKLNLEMSTLKLAHETQLSVCRDHCQITNSEHCFTDNELKEQESLKEKMRLSIQRLEEESRKLRELHEEVQLLRIQIRDKNEVCRKQEDRIQFLESQKQEYATDIATCHQSLEQYKKRIDDLQSRHSEESVLRDSNHHAEVMRLNERITEIQDAHTRQVQSMHIELNRMKQRQMEELATVQLSHENEINTIKRDAERYRNDLRDKNNQLAVQEEQLEEEQQWSKTYSQQVQELGEKLNEEEDRNEEYRVKIESLKQRLKEIDKSCSLYQPQVEFLDQQLKDERQKSTNVMQQLEDVRKQLLLEQEKCKAHCSNIDAANVSIEALQSQHSEVKIQASKLEQNAKQKIKHEQEQNTSLQSEIITLNEKLKDEQIRADSYKLKTETLLQQVKEFKHIQRLLDSEKQLTSNHKIKVETLNQQLRDQEKKHNEYLQKLQFQLEGSQILVQKYQQEQNELRLELNDLQEANFEQKKILDQKISELKLVDYRKAPEDDLKSQKRVQQMVGNDYCDMNQMQVMCDKYSEQMKSLQVKLQVLTDTNELLKKEREDLDIELKKVRKEFDACKVEFESSSGALDKALSEKSEEILKLRKEHEDLVLHKENAHAFNRQVKDLMSSKALLENELASVKDKYCKEIEILKTQVVNLEDKLKICKKTKDEESVEALVRKCRDGIEYLRSHCVPEMDNLKEAGLAKPLNVKPEHANGDYSRKHTIPGLMTLEKLVEACENYVNEHQRGSETTEILSGKLSELAFTVEKLQLELDCLKDENRFLKLEREDLISQAETLNEQNKLLHDRNDQNSMKEHLSYPVSKEADLGSTGMSRIPHVFSRLIKKCEDSENSNKQLKNDVGELQGKLKEVESKLKLKESLQKNPIRMNHWCNCETKFMEERVALKSSVDCLQKDLTDKELLYEDKIKHLLKKQNLNQDESVTNLISDAYCRAKELIVLQNELRKVKFELKLCSCRKSTLEEHLSRSQSSLEVAWQEFGDIEKDLHNALKENSMLRARIMRLETVCDSLKQKEATSSDLMWQLIEELSNCTISKDFEESLDGNRNKPEALEKIGAAVKIINKMNADCESLIVKLQKETDKNPIPEYIQTEALGLRRLQAALLETEKVIVSRSGSVSQLHVDVLKQQLEEKVTLYQDICETHYSLEAEMREMEERFHQQEEHLQEKLCKLKTATRYWQLKAHGTQAQSLALEVIEQSHNDSLSTVIAEIDSVYSHALRSIRDEVERVASLRENKVKMEMTGKIVALERNYKHQMEELGKQIRSGSSVKALQALHQEEIEAIRAESEYARIKAIHKLQEECQELSPVMQPFKVTGNMSFNDISLLFMKHSISSQYNTALKKISFSVHNELVQRLSCLDEELQLACSSHDTIFDVPDFVSDSCLSSLEQLTSQAGNLGNKLLEMQSTKLQAALSVCEESHKLMTSKVQNMVSEFNSLCEVRKLQEELLKVKEEHRLALESLSASHKAEVSRLRLLLSQQNVTEPSETNETALSVLRRELEEKHKCQMEKLRTYFEQKCADFEKHYSEEVFSQHSRKLSDCSSASESELVSEMYYAGPGSSSSGHGAPSHFCDLYGESSFKDLEESVTLGNHEKLCVENREQIEAMRLAIESRHQGELEAQKELYEVKLEELIRNMSESHAVELKLQSKHIQDLQDEEIALSKKLHESEKQIASLKQQLRDITQVDCKDELSKQTKNNETKETMNKNLQRNVLFVSEQNQDGNQFDRKAQVELEAELQRMAETLKRRESESSAQIASLKIKLRESQEVMTKLQKDLSNLRFKCDSNTQSLTSSINEKVHQIQELNQKIEELSSCLEESNSQKQLLDNELSNKCLKLKEECENLLKKNDEEWKVKLADLHSDLTAKYSGNLYQKELEIERVIEEKIKGSIDERKAQLDSEYAEYLEFVKKCADDTKIQLSQQHETKIKQIIESYEKQLSEAIKCPEELTTQNNSKLKEQWEASMLRLQSTLGNESCIKESSLHNCLQDLVKLSSELSINQQEDLEKIIINLCKKEALHQHKLHQDLEMRLESVQKECERRFHLQLEEARGDIVKALEHQIQQLLEDTTDVFDKPPEFQELEKKFASKYIQQLSNLQKEHEAKVAELSEKHASQLSHLRSKNQASNNLAISVDELDKLRKERDCLRNVAATLRDVVGELVRYFMSWEDDFNNTLMEELVRFEADGDQDNVSLTHHEVSAVFHKSVNEQMDCATSEDEMPLIVATPAKGRNLSTSVKRVHFAPDMSGILSLLDDGSLLETVGLNYSVQDASLNFHEELDRCLARLRSESAALYALSKPALPSTPVKQNDKPLSNGEKSSVQSPGKLASALKRVEELQKENEELLSQLQEIHAERETSFAELQITRQRLQTLEHEARRQAEVVAEGFGEGDQSMTCVAPSSPRATTVEELQHKAHSLLLGVSNTDEASGVLSPNSGQHLPHIVEELCRDWERLAEESRHKNDDLQLQVEAADKQLRSFRTFMDEQATEREQERDDFVQEIKHLQELLRDKDRDRTSHQQMNHEVETLEGQLRETQSSLQVAHDKLENLAAEHKQAVEKIWTLRDIISDLEVQLASKAEEASSVAAQNAALQEMVEQQGRTQLELAQEMEALQLCSGNGQLADQISQLEEQLRKHQVLAEQLGDPSAIEQMKIQLDDLVASLEVHTRELECANASCTLPASPCLSSPSEDVSIRETLEALRAASEKKETSGQGNPCVVLPFDEVSKVMEQWQRHARADDAVLKRLRDLDMQFDDVLAEKDALVTRLQEQMLVSSSLQSKLDEHRRKADVKLLQATVEMQSQIEDLRSEINNYLDTLEAREKQIEDLKFSLSQVENDFRRIDAEVCRSSEAEQNIAAQLQSQVSILRADKEKLQALLSEKDALNVSLPVLVESMLHDKNAEIDALEKQVQHLTKQMELTSHYVATPSSTLEFEYCESEKVRAHVELSPVLELRKSLDIPAINESSYGIGHVLPNGTALSLMSHQMSIENNVPEMGPDADESLKPVPLEETMPQQNASNSSASDTMNSSISTFDTSLSICEKKVVALEQDLKTKNQTLAEYLKEINEKATIISTLEKKCNDFEVECEQKWNKVLQLEEELKALTAAIQNESSQAKEELERVVKGKDMEIQQLRSKLSMISTTSMSSLAGDKPSHQHSLPVQESSELEAKESEIQCLRNEVCATQAILANLQRKVQEAKQIARSPSRSSPDNNKALRVVQSELEAAKQEIVELKDLCKSIRSEVEAEYQQKQDQFEVMLCRQQQAEESLLMLNKNQQEDKSNELQILEEQLQESKNKLKEKDDQNQKLASELRQVNMECVTLKQQLSTPISEATALANRLEAEKKFADTLKKELQHFKTRSASLDEDCISLREKVKDLQRRLDLASTAVVMDEENGKLSKENSDLKSSLSSLLKEKSYLNKQIEKLSHNNAALREENSEVGKELSDMKQIIIQMRSDKNSNKEAQEILQSKIKELQEVIIQKNKVSEELLSLRRALKTIHGNILDLQGLSDEDRAILVKLKKQQHSCNLRGAGDGPWNKLSVSETDIHEVRPSNSSLRDSESFDDLTGLVQRELDVSVQLDHSLLQTIDIRKSTQKPIASSVSRRDGIFKEEVQSKLKENGVQSQPETFRLQENVSENKLRALERELHDVKATVQLLLTQLETERTQYFTLQQQDCDLIQEMRMKLSEALDGQAALHLQLQSDLHRRRSSLGDMKEPLESVCTQRNSNNASMIESKEKLQQQLNETSAELLKLRTEKDAVDKQLRRLQEVEIERSRRRAVLEEKHRRRIDQLQALHSETQQECSMLREELTTVNGKLKFAEEALSKGRDAQLKNHTPFVERLKNMNAFLEEHIEENMRMAKQMEDLQEEHRKLRLTIAQLEGQLLEKRSNESFEAANTRFATERAEWEAEQKLLLLALNDAKKKQMHCSDSDVEERVSHLFGRYLRMQSYRKALIWQKRYLLSVLTGFNESKSLAASHLANFSKNFREKQRSPLRRFRSAVMVTIAIHRMQFMVDRWLRGKRIGCEVVVQQTLSHYTLSSSSMPQGPQTLFPSSRTSVPTDEMRSGLLQSPPTLERPRQPRSQSADTFQNSRFSVNNRGLSLTNSLSESVSNFNLVQQRFDALLSNPP